MQKCMKELDGTHEQFCEQLSDIGVWLDKAEGKLKESQQLPVDEQASEVEINKYKVWQSFCMQFRNMWCHASFFLTFLINYK